MKNRVPILVILFASLSWVVNAQSTIRGKVTDPDGEPIIGANVVISGTSSGTITDINGDYTLEAPDDAVLQFSYIGFQTMSVNINGRNVVNVTMDVDVTQLEEVVVSALGFEQNADKLGSTSSIVETELITRSGEANFINGLGAKASNVQVSRTNGDPGAGTTIRIRGANTISGSSNPLIILDGIPVSNSTLYGGGNDATGGRTGGTSQQSRLNDINPADIESVQILKGASAAALWGSRAANGVIVITTKNGSAGKVNIGYKFTTSFDEVNSRIPMQTTWGQGRSGNHSPTQAESWGDYIPDRSGGADEIDQSGQYFEAADGTLYYPITTKNSRDVFEESNWNSVFQTGRFNQHDLTISGGSQKATYFFSGSRLDQEGIIRNSSYNRTNLRFNTDFQLAEWISMSAKAGYTNSYSNRIQQSSNTAGLLLGLLRTPPDFDQRDYIGTYYSSSGEPFPNRHRAYRRYLGGPSTNPIYNNPLWTTNEQVSDTKVDRFIFSPEISITPTEQLQFILRGGIDSYVDNRVYFFPIGSAGDRNPGIYSEDVIGETQLNFDAIGKGNFNLNSDIAMQLTLGWNINDRRRKYNTSTITGFLVNTRKQTTDLNTAAENSQISNTRRSIRSNRGYAVLGFDLYDQVFISASAAAEAASSVKGTFFYPAIDAAWQFTEAIGGGGTGFTFGKLRASWGRVGVQPIPHRFETLAEGGFSYSTYSDPLNVNLFGGGFRLDDDKGNPDLKPEIKTEWEFGADLRFLQDKLAFGFTYYQNKIEGILISVDLTPSSGFDTQYANAAEMENKGLEFDFDYTILRNSDWNVGLFGNWGQNRNKVLDLAGTTTINLSPGASVSSRAIVGEPLGVLYGTGSQTNADGSFLLDANGFPQLTTAPIILGDPNPDWRGGLGARAIWKNFALNILFEHSQGGDFSPRTQWVLRRFGTTAETANRMTTTQDLVNFAGDVVPAGTIVRGNVADFGGGNVLLDESWYRTGIGGGFGDNQAYNFSIADATFTRFKELSLSYNLNSTGFQQKTKLTNVVFTVTGRNLALWTDVVGIDPEINQTGVSNGFGLDYFTNPSTQSWLFSIAINY